MADNPFPSLLLGDEDDAGAEEDDALLQLTGQEEAVLPGVAPGDELELLAPPPRAHAVLGEEDTLINPGDWNDDSAARPGGGGGEADTDTHRAVMHSKTVLSGGAPSLGGKDLAAALPRQTVAAIQKRRAAAEAQGRGWWKDRVWFFWLSTSFLWSVCTFVYAVSTGKLADLATGSSADWVGLGLLQVVEVKTRVFVHVPLVSLLLAVVWLQCARRFPRSSVYAALVAGPLSVLGCAGCLFLHAAAHGAVALMTGSILAMVLGLALSRHWFKSASTHCVLLTSCLLVEGVTWLRHSVRSAAPQRRGGILQRVSAQLDSVHLVTTTLLVLILFLQTAVLAGAVHLWSFTGGPASSTSGPGVFSAYSPHLLLFSLVAASSWAQGFLQAVHRSTIHAVVSARYFAGPAPAPPSATAPGSSSNGNTETSSSSSPAHAPGEGGGVAQGGACDFGNLDSSDGADGPPTGSLVLVPTPLECLVSVCERHGGALAKGSALVGGLQCARTVQLFLEARGPHGHTVVTELVRRCPVMVHSVYVSPHSFVLLAQAEQPMSFLQAAKVIFFILPQMSSVCVLCHLHNRRV